MKKMILASLVLVSLGFSQKQFGAELNDIYKTAPNVYADFVPMPDAYLYSDRIVVYTPNAGSFTYCLSIATSTEGCTLKLSASASNPFMLSTQTLIDSTKKVIESTYPRGN